MNNLCGLAMLQKLPVGTFQWTENTYQFRKMFIENRNEKSDEGYLLEVDIQYPEKLHDLHNDLSFLPETMKSG